MGVHMAESNATKRYETCIRHHSRTCTCGITEQECIAYAAAEAADGDPDCTTGKPLTVSLEFEAGYRKGAADCSGITDRMDELQAKHEALRADVLTVASDPHLEWDEARTMLMATLERRA